MNYRLALALLPALLFVGACKSVNFDTNTEMRTETREIAAFNRIKTEGSLDLYVRVGPAQTIEVEAPANEISLIATEVKNGELRVYRKSGITVEFSFKSSPGLNLNITVPTLNALTHEGSGDVFIEALNGDSFELIHDGSGDIGLEGQCKTLSLTHEGSGDVNAKGLTCSDATLKLDGSGEVRLSVSGSLDLSLNGSGDLDIWGTPRLAGFRQSGSGDLHIRN